MPLSKEPRAASYTIPYCSPGRGESGGAAQADPKELAEDVKELDECIS